MDDDQAEIDALRQKVAQAEEEARIAREQRQIIQDRVSYIKKHPVRWLVKKLTHMGS